MRQMQLVPEIRDSEARDRNINDLNFFNIFFPFFLSNVFFNLNEATTFYQYTSKHRCDYTYDH